ncbi:cardiomyopathy-associated protein 5-like [Solea senegalensis]|uniref:Cardiomyopathy-associated protein 5-like n=1 Tax=Solea senegalensis TaxID=28829 RepID=A0AAV6QH97_SOLSE|nr:cardiomyopathy-associated protein 5 [Solea senegalensis]KAG7489496.1 cardiomyopathy-associated protein 5-like [Solea senegalensis]
MEECESLDPEMTDLQEFSETISQDDEDEVEELQNSLREVVQDQSVKPKLQCLMVDPSFSMVTVQSEDSGIVWETASSRCSTPWASETSSISEGYSMEGSGAAGKITIVFDEDKVIRRRTRSGGRSSRLGDRLSRPGSSRSASALGVERPEMFEVSLPNVKQEKTETVPDLEEIKNKDQQLFSLISEGYEILNIRVPSKLPTVDEEESTDLQDNLSYLDETPKIRSRNHQEWTKLQDHVQPEEEEIPDHQEPSAFAEPGDTSTQRESTSDIDYFEKFTLLDVAAPGEHVPESQEEAQEPQVEHQAEEQKPAKETAPDSPTAPEESFVFVTDEEIIGEHLDQVFYGGAPTDAQQRKDNEEVDGGARMRMRRESQRSTKESGSVLFGSEETILTPIYISDGPPKIIDLILLEEPTAMSFMYTDLYEDAVGQRLKSDEEHSEAESITSEKSYKRRFSDSDEADGYLEKFTLKDETPTVEVQPQSVEDKREGRMMWSQNRFELTGHLTRTEGEEDDESKAEKPKTREEKDGDSSNNVQSGSFEKKSAIKKSALLTKQQAEGEASEKSIRTSKLTEIKEVKQKRDHTDPPSSSTGKVKLTQRESEGHQREECKTSITESEQHNAGDKMAEVIVKADKTTVDAPVHKEVMDVKSKMQTEATEKSLSEGAAKMVAPDAKRATLAKAAALTQDEEEEVFTLAEPSAEISVSKDTVAAEDEPTVEVITDFDCVVQAIMEVTKNAVNEEDRQTQVQIDLQDVTSTETTAEKQHKVLTEETANERSEVIPDRSRVVTEPVMMRAEVKTDSDKKCQEIRAEELVTGSELNKTKLITEAQPTTEDTTSVRDELVLLVPSGQAVEMDIGVSQLSEKTTNDAEVVPKPETEDAMAPIEETKTESPCETQREVAVKVDELITKDFDRKYTLPASSVPPAPLEEPDTEEKKTEEDVKEDVGVLSPVKSFTPQESQLEIQPDVAVKVDEPIKDDLDRKYTPPAPLDKTDTKQKKTEEDLKQDVGSPLKSFTPPAIPLEIQPEVAVKVDELIRNDLDRKYTPLAPSIPPTPLDKPDTKQKKTEENVKEDVSVLSPLKSFTPQESPLEIQPEVAVKVEELIRNDLDRKYTPPAPPVPPAPQEEPETEERKMEEDLKEDVGVYSPLKSFTPQESPLEIQPVKVDELIRNDLDRTYTPLAPPIPPAPMEEPDTKEKKMEENLIEGMSVVSRLRSFTPLEDLSGLHRKEVLAEDAGVGEKVELNKVDDASEAVIIAEDVGPGIDLQRVDVGKKMEQDEMVAEVSEIPVEELGYEVISKQDAEETPESGLQRDAEESRPESGQDKRERLDVAMEMEEKAFDLSPEEELIEADYDIIDAEEESQARLAAELQGMDWFCLTCGCLLSEDDRGSGKHHDHELTTVDKAYEDIKEKLSDWISELQGRSENIEDLVSELELAYNTVEDQFVESEAVIQAQNEEMMTLVMEQYNNMSVSMEEEKKSKLERLYDQIVSFQESIDTTKTTLETTAREAETDARSPEDIHTRLKSALDSAMSLELGPKGLLVFEDYAKGNASGSHLAQRKGIPVPQRPTLQPQEPGSASSTSVTVYWNVNPGDIIDCFQVYCMEDPQGAVSEEYRVTVKESYCVLEELDPDKTYKVWVMAVNYTGCSLPSERLGFRTAPSVPVIDTEHCTVMWDSATLRWRRQVPGLTYTLEYCRQYELEGEGLRSISGIECCEQKVLLQPNENYLFYIKAVNEAGASEQSEAALISTKGTRFHLLKASAHPALELSMDHTTLHFHQDTHENTSVTEKECPSILGELLPARGRHYWETIVSESAAYRLGVTYNSAATRDSSLGGNSLSWCLQCVPTPSGCSYQLLHNDVQTSVFAIEMPERVGVLLDYQLGHLSFFNAQSGQLLGSFSQHFTQPCHPALALEMPGSLEVCMVQEVPEFTRDS